MLAAAREFESRRCTGSKNPSGPVMPGIARTEKSGASKREKEEEVVVMTGDAVRTTGALPA